MVFHTYSKESKGWIESRKHILAERLKKIVKGQKFSGEPYVEVDGLIPGVSIRHVTHLSEKELDKLHSKTDKIYKEVMDIK